jgi:hypothetical protein
MDAKTIFRSPEYGDDNVGVQVTFHFYLIISLND